jgi:hypothetical protein
LEEYNQTHRNCGRDEVALKKLFTRFGIQTPRISKVAIVVVLPSNGDGGPLPHVRGAGGGRVLKRRDDKSKNGLWKEVTDEVVLIDKVCSALRGVRQRAKDAAALDKIYK